MIGDLIDYKTAVQTMIDQKSELIVTIYNYEHVQTFLSTIIENAREEIKIFTKDFHNSIYRKLIPYLNDSAIAGINISVFSDKFKESYTTPINIELTTVKTIKTDLHFMVVDKKMWRMENNDIRGYACVNGPELGEKIIETINSYL